MAPMINLEKDPKHIQMDICDFITHLRKSGRSPGTVSSYVPALRKFYDMNDIELNWRKIHSFEGEMEKTTDDRPYTHGNCNNKWLLQVCYGFSYKWVCDY
jgi:hypothetical protein